jgi:predicted component of type VI protein secretion system
MIASKFGRASLKLFGPDYEKYLSTEQFRLYQAGGAWFLEHCPGATNQTNVNGKQLTVPVALKNGMTVTVGKSGMCPITFRVA